MVPAAVVVVTVDPAKTTTGSVTTYFATMILPYA
jgi:hypothetical protein